MKKLNKTKNQYNDSKLENNQKEIKRFSKFCIGRQNIWTFEILVQRK